MADDKPVTSDKPIEGAPMKVTEEELQASVSGPAFFSNKVYATKIPAGLRLAFMEQYRRTAPPQFRTAVLLSYADAISLKNLLIRHLADVEEQLRQADDAGEQDQVSTDA